MLLFSLPQYQGNVSRLGPFKLKLTSLHAGLRTDDGRSDIRMHRNPLTQMSIPICKASPGHARNEENPETPVRE